MSSAEHAPKDPESQFALMTINQVRQTFSMEGTPTGSAWHRYCDREGIYEYPTAEYVILLAHYLGGRLTRIAQHRQERSRMLEAGAGQGRLSFLLQKIFEQHEVPAEVLAVDDGSWPLGWTAPHVQGMDYRTALAQFRPHLVIAAWPPDRSEDWGADFREQPTVDEYIAIGDPRKLAIMRPHQVLQKSELYVPWSDYEADGFERVELEALRPFQLNYTDYVASGQLHQSSTTVSYRRLGTDELRR